MEKEGELEKDMLRMVSASTALTPTARWLERNGTVTSARLYTTSGKVFLIWGQEDELPKGRVREVGVGRVEGRWREVGGLS
jgi:hypothetical protein